MVSPGIKGFFMTAFGFRYRFRNAHNQRSWTETFYREFGAVTLGSTFVKSTVTLLAARRVACLSTGNSLVDVACFDPINPRSVIYYELDLPGGLGLVGHVAAFQDTAPVSVLVRCSSIRAVRQYLMRGIADDDVLEGEFHPIGGHVVAYNAWFASLVSQPLLIRRRPPLVAPIPIGVIGTGGITLGQVPVVGIPADTPISVVTQVSGGGRRVRTNLVTKSASRGSFIDVDWTWGNCGGGYMTVLDNTYEPIIATAQRVATRTRKTGGPLGKFRGRR